MDQKFTKGAPLPSLPACVDLYRETRDLRLAMQKVVDGVKAREDEISAHLIDNIPKLDATGVAGKQFRAQIVTKVVPKADDWEAIKEYIRQTDSFDLLSKTLSVTAVRDRWEAGEEVPGVGKFNAVTVSITKI